MFGKAYFALMGLTITATAGGLLTLLPREAASYPNLAGYRSVCTFAPAATLYCFLIAGVSCLIRSTLIKDKSGSPGERIRRHSKSLIPLVLVLAGALAFTVHYGNIKRIYTDDTTAATEAVTN
ncbi:MAG: hypothetical protein PQJ58_14755 [Spirochaetales bacterium]|nr:hypothetical protein [Spirochaetales bacterium]